MYFKSAIICSNDIGTKLSHRDVRRWHIFADYICFMYEMVMVKILSYGVLFLRLLAHYACGNKLNFLWVLTLNRDPECSIDQYISTYLFFSFQHVTMNWSGCPKYASWTTSRFWIYPTIILNSWMDWKSLNFFLGSVWPITKSRLFSNWINVFILNI